MKKTLTLIISCCLISACVLAQDGAKSDFDKKWRFGLRVTPQPIWLVSNDKNNIPDGTTMGIGFGLNMEYRFSDVAGFLTGIGGDFEGGKYKFKFDPANNYVVQYRRDADDFIEPGNKSATSSLYTLKDRTIQTTHVTIPLILKLSTQEYGGFKYFGMFGGELGIRVKTTATDRYYDVSKIDPKTGLETIVATDTEETDINLSDEGTLIPMRIGINAGLGTEYRLGGSTSLFFSVNFFRSFVSVLQSESEVAYYRVEGNDYKYIKQNIKQTAIRLNFGVMF